MNSEQVVVKTVTCKPNCLCDSCQRDPVIQCTIFNAKRFVAYKTKVTIYLSNMQHLYNQFNLICHENMYNLPISQQVMIMLHSAYITQYHMLCVHAEL